MEGTAQGVQLVLKTSVRASVGVRVLCPPPFQCSVTDTRSAVNREKGVRFLPLELHALVTEGIGAGLQTQSWEFESPPVLHAVVAQLEEHHLAKVGVEGSSPFYCSKRQ
jgi:hypothetical protein